MPDIAGKLRAVLEPLGILGEYDGQAWHGTFEVNVGSIKANGFRESIRQAFGEGVYFFPEMQPIDQVKSPEELALDFAQRNSQVDDFSEFREPVACVSATIHSRNCLFQNTESYGYACKKVKSVLDSNDISLDRALQQTLTDPGLIPINQDQATLMLIRKILNADCVVAETSPGGTGESPRNILCASKECIENIRRV